MARGWHTKVWHANGKAIWQVGDSAKISELDQQKQLDGFIAQNPEIVKDLDSLENTVCGVECGPGTMRADVDYDAG